MYNKMHLNNFYSNDNKIYIVSYLNRENSVQINFQTISDNWCWRNRKSNNVSCIRNTSRWLLRFRRKAIIIVYCIGEFRSILQYIETPSCHGLLLGWAEAENTLCGRRVPWKASRHPRHPYIPAVRIPVSWRVPPAIAVIRPVLPAVRAASK